jgi:glycosyltransferase involved in cell wall biosynthesis
MRASIVIRNYNYAEFLRDALDSALAQTYADTEVVVVDDGSTDGSREILKGYGNRCRVILKANGGEGDAINAGFAQATGDIVIFLDSDDVLAPDAVSEIVSVWKEQTTRVHFKLWAMNREGMLFSDPLPAFDVPDLSLQEFLHRYGHVFSVAQSANAYAASTLRKILPLDVERWYRGPDIFLNALALADGPSEWIQYPLGGYRLHDTSLRWQNSQAIEQKDHLVLAHPRLFEAVHAYVGETLWADFRPRHNAYHLLHRVLSFRLNPGHPFKDDRLSTLAMRSAGAVVRRPHTSLTRRFLLLSGLLAACVLPRSSLHSLLPSLLHMARRTSLPPAMRRHRANANPRGAQDWRKFYGVSNTSALP